ncbi:Peptide chain release factor eRF1/aRF1 [Corchorus capsularis]|uniref:Peptide chain release factor eRF1/aRF1 n=1 Tax=Corchorus capsularis TaxID=210143 RepID=A0A1R3GQN6_COCAP|nr:Peptide chain release factor eRF1/aRF1 [Corchorus capsularis]
MAESSETHDDATIEAWKLKKMIKSLDEARGNGTSMISLIIPPGDQISNVTKRLAEEYATSSNIKSRVNRQSVQAAITSALQRLKRYKNVPPNGLVIYAGTAMTEEAGKGKKKFVYDLMPFKPVTSYLYKCDNKFHTDALKQALESDDKFGFIIIDGHGTLYGTLSGNSREIVHKFNVQLPNKHGRGGQSQNRLSRIGAEKRQNYLRKAAELATKFFIDPHILADLKFVQQKRLIEKFFEEINQDTKKYVFGVEDTIKVLEMGAIQTLMVWENLEINRYVLKNNATNEIVIKHSSKEQEADERNLRDPATEAQLEVEEQMVLLEWLADNYKRFGCSLEIVTDGSQEGSQFCKGFGGIGGILQYKLDLRLFDEDEDDQGVYEASD